MSCPLPILSFGSIPSPLPQELPGFPTVVLPNPSQSTTTITPPSEVPIKKNGKKVDSSLNNNFDHDHLPDLKHLTRTVLNAKRIAVVCGAGISTACGIPDFRSSTGLFESLKLKYPEAKLSSGKDLFDASFSFSSEENTRIYYNMIAELRKQTDLVEPSKFHYWLKSLDDQGKLFRVYTQNIDSLEERAGLSYGLGSATAKVTSNTPTPTVPSPRSPPAELSLPPDSSQTSTCSSLSLNNRSNSSSSLSSLSSLSSCSDSDTEEEEKEAIILPSSSSSQQSTSSLNSTTTTTIPRCIPLHGHLSTLTCILCSTTYPLTPYLPTLSLGTSPTCPQCFSQSQTRLLQNRRSLGIGYLKPDVVLYGESHKDGLRIGEITSKDLGKGKRPDLLLVVGTTLKVPGTKKLVKELSKVIKPPSKTTEGGGGKSKRGKKKDKVHTIFLNKEFPGGGKEWNGVFDCWVRGDIQEFVTQLEQEKSLLDQEMEEKKKVEKDSSSGKKKIKNSKLPIRPKNTTSTTSTTQTSSKRRSPPTPTKSPIRKQFPSSFQITVPSPTKQSQQPSQRSTTTSTTTLKRARRSSPPVLVSPLLPESSSTLGSTNELETTIRTRRSGRISSSSATNLMSSQTTTTTTITTTSKKPVSLGGLGFGVSKKGVLSTVTEKNKDKSKDEAGGVLENNVGRSTRRSTRSTRSTRV